MMKGKKGVEITTGTLIIIILAVIALIVILALFMGGFGKVADTIKEVFSRATQGVSYELAIQNCQQYCDRAQSLPTGIRKQSAYCTTKFNIDKDSNGEADFVSGSNPKKYYTYHCYVGSDGNPNTEDKYLNTECLEPETNQQLTC